MKNNKVVYTDAPDDLQIDESARPLTRAEEKKLGIPSPAEVKRYLAKEAKAERINLRLSAVDLSEVKVVAAEAGMPYQTLIAAVIHQVATRKIKVRIA